MIVQACRSHLTGIPCLTACWRVQQQQQKNPMQCCAKHAARYGHQLLRSRRLYWSSNWDDGALSWPAGVHTAVATEG